MALRVALVTPFAWSQPHDVNEHVAGLARELRARGHSVTVLAPSNRARDLAAGRRALATGASADFIALGPAVPISRRSRMGVPVGVRANLTVALASGGFDIVHGFEPGLPEPLVSRAPRRKRPDRRDVPLCGTARRTRPRARGASGCSAGSTRCSRRATETAEAAAERFPGRYELVPLGVEPSSSSRRRSGSSSCSSGGQTERPLLRALARELAELPDWELVLLRTRPLASRPPLPRALRGRARVRTALDALARADAPARGGGLRAGGRRDPARRARGARRRRSGRVAARPRSASRSSPPPRRRG